MFSKNKIKEINALERKKERMAQQAFVAEGPKVVGDLINGGMQVREVFAVAEWLQRAEQEGLLGRLGNGVSVDEVTQDQLRKLSFLQHPQQVLAVFDMPRQNASDATAICSHELVLALDGVQDPGNMGTIIRIADWFGIRHIYCSQECADIWNPKVVQATMGSLARVQVKVCNLPGLINTLPADVPVYGTLLDGNNLYKEQLSQYGMIVMGNEGKGLTPEVRKLVTHRLLIPNYPPDAPTAESLNVAIATAVVCAEFRRGNC